MQLIMMWAAISVAIGLVIWSAREDGRRSAAQEILEALKAARPSGVNMAVPSDFLERIDKIGGIRRPRATKRRAP
ncbi:hypothetical protein [Methyloceanibacter caenitepidi]|uniref:Uncharacterized protein n=1 Tax=Methyloceanibacter caenitepidi TaxID=1384459 RepID=A0A0A8K216_9HYPH|nr:hypothetical protein [Methyloceanibacter caenitepidi]BAQ16940.1 hypothetical protein GL4_1484 [Methyloceanibacter caenitepidi]